MNILYNRIFLNHHTGSHPENPSRLEGFAFLPDTPLTPDSTRIELVHTKQYVEFVRLCSKQEQPLDSETPTCEHTFDVALYGSTAACLAAEKGEFALLRPPGHHAYSDHTHGFCVFNNVAIATQHLLTNGQAKKVFILDIDGHLGDGTEAFFYKRNDVLYWSLHQYPAFPGGGSVEEIGEDEGKGFTLNVPLPPGTGDDIYMDALRAFLPVAIQFEPDVVAISAGFDTYKDDQLLDLRLSLATYFEIGALLNNNFGRVFAILEGGYNSSILPKAVENLLDGLNGKKIKYQEIYTQSPKFVGDAYKKQKERLAILLRGYWKL